MTEDETKELIRTAMKAKRNALSSEDISLRSAAVISHIASLEIYKNAKTVMTYLSSFKEPSTDLLLPMLYKDGKRVVVPISNTADFSITPSYLTSPDVLEKGAYGIMEPSECIDVMINDIDIALIPGIAFDRRGNRIGFGKGYYDKFLAEFTGIKIGVCYDFQIFGHIPASAHDVKMDMLITEKRIYNDF